MPLPIHKFLDLSTGHLPENICAALSSFAGVVAYETQYGWLMAVPSDPDTDTDTPAEVRVVQKFAREHDCVYVLFDRDAEIIDALPSWEW